MYICILDGRELKSREMLHDKLASALEFPEWYGRNLDALYDCLTDALEEVEIRFLHMGEMEEGLGGYTTPLMQAVCRAAEDNPKIHIKIEENREDD